MCIGSPHVPAALRPSAIAISVIFALYSKFPTRYHFLEVDATTASQLWRPAALHFLIHLLILRMYRLYHCKDVFTASWRLPANLEAWMNNMVQYSIWLSNKSKEDRYREWMIVQGNNLKRLKRKR